LRLIRSIFKRFKRKSRRIRWIAAAAERTEEFFEGLEVLEIVERDNLREKTLFLEGSRKSPKWLHFVCPCGCREIRSVNLMTKYSPYWTIEITAGDKVSVSPSVWITAECRSHFWIYKNKVLWASSRSGRGSGEYRRFPTNANLRKDNP